MEPWYSDYMKIYIISNVLTNGILTADAEIDVDGYATVKSETGSCLYCVRPSHWKADAEAALSAAERIRGRAIAVAERKVLKLKAIKFTTGV